MRTAPSACRRWGRVAAAMTGPRDSHLRRRQEDQPSSRAQVLKLEGRCARGVSHQRKQPVAPLESALRARKCISSSWPRPARIAAYERFWRTLGTV